MGAHAELRRDVDSAQEPPMVWDETVSHGWYRGLTLRGGLDRWSLSLLDDESASDPGVDTRENYVIESVYLYRLQGTLSTRYLEIHGTFASDQGLNLVQNPSIALDFLVAFSGIDALQPLSFNVRHLDFDYGQVNLKDRDSGLDLEVARFQTTLSRYELRYALGTHLYVLGQMQSYGLPRNVYLEFGDEGGERVQISDQLLHVDSRFFGLGVGLESPPSDAAGWHGALRMSVGVGRYDIKTLVGRETLDSGDLSAIDLSGRVGHRWALSQSLRLGVAGELNLLDLTPSGLPDDLNEYLLSEGVDPGVAALRFGKKDLVSAVTLELIWSI